MQDPVVTRSSVKCLTLESGILGFSNDKATVEVIASAGRVERNADDIIRKGRVLSVGDWHLERSK